MNFDIVRELLRKYEASEIDRRISSKDPMYNQWYFEAGRSSVEILKIALLASKLQVVGKVLDIPCGYGRVLRHLSHLFPEAEFHACDLDTDAVDFCASTFGARPVYSREELADVDFGSLFDLIWVGSLFTHTPRDTTRRWLAHLAKFLSPQGIVVATFHGRWCEHVHQVAPYIGEDRWQGILEDFSSQGYGYRNYTRQESHPYISGGYGISLTKPHVTIQDVEDIPDVRIYIYMERGWADVQDVVVFGHPRFDEPWPGMHREEQAQEGQGRQEKGI